MSSQHPAAGARWVFPLVTGTVLFALGSYVALRPLWRPNGVVTGSRWLDMAFAAVFMLRGVINVRTGIARRRDASSHA